MRRVAVLTASGVLANFGGIRTRGGLMGYPNPHESDYDLFMTGHAGCSVSCALGLKVGDDLRGRGERHSVAVIGDGALPSGIVFEAFDQRGEFRAIAGGGRYDNLVKLLSAGKVDLPALGFGMGDVVLLELLKAAVGADVRDHMSVVREQTGEDREDVDAHGGRLSGGDEPRPTRRDP